MNPIKECLLMSTIKLNFKIKRILIVLTLSISIQVCIGQSKEDAQHAVTKLYGFINYGGKNLPDYDTALALFTKDAKLKWTMPDTVLSFTPKEFFTLMKNQIDQGILLKASEVEIDNRSQYFGNIAHFFSSYITIVNTPQGENKKRGINSIQLVRNRDEWKIASIIWYDEDESNLIPKTLSEEMHKDRLAIKRAALNYIESIYEVDKEKLKSVSKNLNKQGYYLSIKDSSWSVSPMTYEELEHTVETYNKQGRLPDSSPKSVEILDIDAIVANVKVYAIWGFDYLLMTKSDEGEWVIQQILWQSYTFPNGKRMVEQIRKKN